MIPNYDAVNQEPEILKFWKEHGIYEKAKEKNKGKQKFYFLDGPPYTSGKVHLGTAWNKALKDCVLRYKRMQGLDVWDKAGYDMHGLPIEHQVIKKFNLETKNDIEKFGVARFINECMEFAIESMQSMNKDFLRLGTWMDFENAYMPIVPESIESIWWLIKKVHEQKRLYEGFRTMTWCASCETALAKHELNYKEVKDHSIFLKFKIKDKSNDYLIVWTTTPWTIPFNLGVMANPEVAYVKAKVGNECWVIAKDLSHALISDMLGKKVEIVEEFQGKSLEGMEYIPVLYNELRQIYDDIKSKAPKTHTVILSSEYVDTSTGTGLVHMAPGCGPEDYEVGHRNSIPPFNNLDERGIFPDEMGAFAGFTAKKDDLKFVEHFKKNGSLAAESKLEHDYAHCWRCGNPIIYRATKQWFFKVEDLKSSMLGENKKIKWIPKASFNAFESWLSNLRDNSITKQRFWGTPLPVWRCSSCSKFDVLSSRDEIRKAAGKVPEKLHKPWIDEIKYSCECGGLKERIPDIMDVWIDPGCASWICLNYPHQTKLFDEMFPADFILEGIDQYRGWFNVLMVCSMLAFRKASFKSCYVHGFINDAQGRKMSKSLGNYILPQEVIMEYGADTLRYYMIGGASPGVDINYNFDDMKVKHKNLTVLWNLHKYVIEMAKNLKVNPRDLSRQKFEVEELYIFSKLNSAIKKATELSEEYRLNEIPWKVEELFLVLSRTYIQLTRDKASMGSEEEKKAVLYAVFNVLLESLKLFAPIAPFITEMMYQNLRHEFRMKEESIHLFGWPECNEELIDDKLESSMQIVGDIVQSALAVRERIHLGIRWPLKEMVIAAKDMNVVNAAEMLKDVIKKQINVKEIGIVESMRNVRLKVKADYSKMGPEFGDKVPKIIAQLTIDSPETVMRQIQEKGKYSLDADGEEVSITKEHLIVERNIPLPYEEGAFRNGFVYLNREMTDKLEAEGFAREIMRRVQALRKKAGLQKSDSISLFIKTDDELKEMLKEWNLLIKEKVGASQFRISELEPSRKHAFTSKEKVKGKEFEIGFDKV